MAAPTVADVQTELTPTRVAVAGYSTPTGHQITNRNPLTVLETIERLQSHTDRAAHGIVQTNVEFGA